MNIDSVFPSDYLKAADLKGKVVSVTIESVSLEELGSEKKAVVHFVGKERGLVLNKTNAAVIKSAYGSDTEGWTDKTIELRPDKTQFQGQLVDCLRVQIPAQRADEGSEPPF